MSSKKQVDYDYSNMLADKVGRRGETKVQLRHLLPRLNAARKAVLGRGASEPPGFLSIPERKKDIRKAVETAADVRKRFKTLIVIGIGGSDLGARVLLDALGDRKKGMEVRFAGANTDPESLVALLDDVDLKKCALNIISKSGNTIEPMSTFFLLRDRLIRKVGKKRHAAHVIATTDPENGTLRTIADREGYRTLPVPDDIGGRFSALTPVGLFPAAGGGVSVPDLISGARAIRDSFRKDGARQNGPLLFAGLHHDAHVRRAQDITVLMPYADSLKEFGAWFRQLWAESLGKRVSRSGEVVNTGLTPVAALGATDQHSQLQLYNEGPYDKLVTFIESDRFRNDLRVPVAHGDLEGAAYMSGHNFSRIIHAERAATALALTVSGRPNGTLFVPDISGKSVGGLMMFFMLATAVMGELMDIDVYDQPGVEAGKRAMYGMLGRKGFTKM